MLKKILTEADKRYVDLFCKYLYQNMGINTEEPKKPLLTQKLLKLMYTEDVETLGEYYHFVVSPPISEKQKIIQNRFVDTITVHKTSFFREINHFKFLEKAINEIVENSRNVKERGELRIWSSACSTGEEPYTLAMVLKEILPTNIVPKILGSDISKQSVQKAIIGRYKLGIEDEIPINYLNKWLIPDGNEHVVKEELKKYVTFRYFNLMDPFPFRSPFDIIFCRNVMIYFDTNVQEKLINNFYSHVADKGYLFIGHSESLIKINHKFNYQEPTIYQK